MKKLTEIGNKHTTDKGTQHYEAHGYTEIYNDFISDKDKLTLLEIGVWHGDSVRMWNEYNKNINLHVIDIDPKVSNYMTNGEKMTLHIGNQSDHTFLRSVLNKIDVLDVVIDDGSHYFNDIMNSFNTIFPKLKSGGIYFIEDLHAVVANRDEVIKIIAPLSDIENFELTCNNKLLRIVKK